MSRLFKAVAAVTVAAAAWSAHAQHAKSFPGVGREATPAEVAAWNIDVRPDFQGLPKGSGSVAKGQEVWESRCAACHGIFAESNEVFTPLVGGTTPEDIKTGHVANLKRTDFPARTTLMKVSTVSTLFDYINRAMPWNAPKSLKTDEVYAVTAYLLNMGGILPDNFVMSDKNIAEVQARMPNRNGMTTDHAMWPGKEFKGAAKPDVKAVACMSNCPVEGKVASMLPDFARNQHGNLAEQNRLVGAQHGADTTRPEGARGSKQAAAATTVAQGGGSGESKAPMDLLQKNTCTACHSVDHKLVGPAFKDVAAKYPGKAEYLAGKIRSGGMGIWGSIPMPPQSLSDADAKRISEWLASGANQ